MADLLQQDHHRGIATFHQRLLLRTAIAADLSTDFGYMEAMGATLCAIVKELQAHWSDEVDALPYYPAFRK